VEKDLIIGIDSSTTACKAIAWNAHGQAVAEHRVEFGLQSPQPTWFEQPAQAWWDALIQALRAVSARVGRDRIAALCIANQRETFVLVDDQCRPLRDAILWMDERARTQVDELQHVLGHEVIQAITGKGPSTKQALPKFLWLQQNEPDVLRRAHKILDVHAFLVYHLTGQWITSLPAVDPMAVADLQHGQLASDLLEKLGIAPEKFVEIVPPGTVLGTLTRQAADLTGLLPETPVIAGVGDGQSAGLGANITAPGRAYLNLGTAVICGLHQETYITDRAFRTMGSAIPGAFALEGVLASGTFLIRWFADHFGPDTHTLGLPLAPEELLEMAAQKVPPGALGLMVVPYWGAALAPYWDAAATGITIGWTGGHRREHFYRAILEGLAYELRLIGGGMAQAVNHPLNELILMGGGSRSDVWCQIIADVTGIPATRAGTTEASCLGAAILAAASIGWYPDCRAAAHAMTHTERSFQPDAAAHALYERLYTEVYRGIFPALQPSVDRLTALTGSGQG